MFYHTSILLPVVDPTSVYTFGSVNHTTLFNHSRGLVYFLTKFGVNTHYLVGDSTFPYFC